MTTARSYFGICLILLAVLFWPSSLSASQGYRVKTSFPAPRLLSPSEELLISDSGTAEFRWSQAYLPRGGFYDFRIYEGTKQVQSTLIFKSRVPSNKTSIQVSADFFIDGKLYAWSVRSVAPRDKSRSNYSIFRVKRRGVLPAGAEPVKNQKSENHGHEKFEMIMVRGVVTLYDFKTPSPWLKIKDETGKEYTAAVDFKVSKINSDGKEVEWGSLKEGAKVEMVYATENASENRPAKLVLHLVTVLS